ncbi:hypothetical protein MMC29_007387, partial [Sticta canariensis]|nr:hypothetical protein [Sticta canariensis]
MPSSGIDDPCAAESREPELMGRSNLRSKYDGSTGEIETVNKVISHHTHGAPAGEADFTITRSKVKSQGQRFVKKVMFKDTTGAGGQTMDAWSLRFLMVELDSSKSSAVPFELVATNGRCVWREVATVKGDEKITLDRLIGNLEGTRSELIIEYYHSDTEKVCEPELMAMNCLTEWMKSSPATGSSPNCESGHKRPSLRPFVIAGWG